MKAVLNYTSKPARTIDLPDDAPTPAVVVCQQSNTVHVLARTVEHYEYDEVPFYFLGVKKKFHGKAGR